MKTDKDLNSMPDQAFDLRVRAELALAYESGDPPRHLFRRQAPLLRRRAVRRFVAALLLGASCSGAVLAVRPPALVRGVLEHESHERDLRGSYMNQRELLARLGVANMKDVPGLPQLMRPCDVDGRLAYHLITYFDQGGMVTIFAFDAPVELQDGSGWWNNVHWQVARSADGRPIVLVAPRQKALSIALAALQDPTVQPHSR